LINRETGRKNENIDDYIQYRGKIHAADERRLWCENLCVTMKWKLAVLYLISNNSNNDPDFCLDEDREPEEIIH
jgi:hypothetical protein